MTANTDVLVRRDDLSRSELRTREEPPLAAGEARLAVQLFALTANNITYAVAGDSMSYWNFFPAPEGFGRIPVWGFAEVTESRADGLQAGERVYGYLPMSRLLTVLAGRIGPAGFTDLAPHRQKMAAVYNQYQRAAADPLHRPGDEEAIAVLRPLFTTGFVIADLFADNSCYGAATIYVLSASSKTALATAACLQGMKGPGVTVAGVTSARNRAFVERTGYYDRVLDYAALDEEPAQGAAALIDMSGDAQALAAAHRRFGERIAMSLRVGLTHWTAADPRAGLPGPKPVWFFAPDQIRKRHADWGAEGFGRRVAEAWRAFLGSTRPWLAFDARTGADAILAALGDVRDGRIPPERAVVCRW